MEPLVSVVVATYNQAWCIDEAIESVLAQTYGRFEVIVVDDGSTDATAARLARYGRRITSIRQANRGMRGTRVVGGGQTRNTGIEQARGELIAFLDGDDVWERDKLAVQVATFRDHPRSGLVAVDGVEFDHDDGRVLSPTLLDDLGGRLAEGQTVSARLHAELLVRSLIASPSQTMVPARVLRELGPFAPILGADYELCLRIAVRHEITLVRRSLVRWRFHEGSASGPATLRSARWARARVNALRTHLATAPAELSPVVRAALGEAMTRAAREAYYHGRRFGRRPASRALWHLARENPGSTVPARYLAALFLPERLTTLVARATRPRPRPS
ncbi:MAG TPA: glycosyltransferase [Candidatus Limnocylindrales bacterium]|nr:glycosyltransferase [Candidatus Limnocylindrales bacterium]